MMDVNLSLPGVYHQNQFPPPGVPFLTGVPLFLGMTTAGTPNTPTLLTVWPDFDRLLGPPVDGGYLRPAVRGFFENDGLLCFVIPLYRPENPTPADLLRSLEEGLAAAAAVEEADLICVPDLFGPLIQTADPSVDQIGALFDRVLDHCRRLGNRFAILDAPAVVAEAVAATAARSSGDFGAFYTPWLITAAGAQPLPPCGHVAGLYARSDQQFGSHKPSANDPVWGVVDLSTLLDRPDHITLREHQINYLAPFPGRGIRVWGARTAAGNPINVRRLLITITRWLERFMTGLAHEPNTFQLWVRIMRETSAYLDTLFRLGALKGRVPEEAFYVKCDSSTNPPDVRRAGRVVTEIGVAPVQPTEFIVVRVVHGDGGVAVAAV